jgi:Protein of unknown function (DUF3108)
MHATAGSWNRLLAPAAVPLLFLVAAAVFLWPLPLQFTTHLAAPEGPGDPYLNLWILGWDLHALTTAPATLLDGRIFDANIFHPASGTLAYSDHLILQALILLPIYLATSDLVVCYNVLLIGSLAASGWAMYSLARALSASREGALVAGLAWAFWPYRFAHLIHLQLQSLYFLPLALLFLHRTIARRRRRDALALGVVAALQAISSVYYGVMTAVMLVLVALVLLAGVGRWRNPATLRRLALSALVAALLVAPFVWPYLRVQEREGFARNLYEASRHEARAWSYLQVPSANVPYGRTGILTARDAQGQLRARWVEGVEQQLFPGLLLILLAGAGLVGLRQRANWPVHCAMGLLILAGFLLSLGPDSVRALYATLHGSVFGFQAIRAPARFSVLVVLGLSVLAASGVSRLLAATRVKAAGVVLAAFVALEYLSVPLAFVERPPRTTDVGQWLARAPGPGAVVHLPLTHDRENTSAMVQSLEHWRRIVNGYSGQRPAFFPSLVDRLSSFPSADGLLTLKDLGVRFVVSPEPLGPVDDAARASGRLPPDETPLVERASFAGGVIYELAWTPEWDTRLVPPPIAPPPPPGPAPFAVGESLQYDVLWEGGPLDISAGRVEVSVEPAEGANRRLVATAETAPWVSRFFEARDRFETDADGELFPIVHRREQQQGRRQIRRRFEYDRSAGLVRMINLAGAGDVVPFRIPPGTRDALTAFFYVRTLPLAPGTAIRLPVNDAGRNLVVELVVAGREDVSLNGRRVPALRLEPRLIERVPRRAPTQVRVWLSEDGRRVPLLAEVAAGFGRVKLRLRGPQD